MEICVYEVCMLTATLLNAMQYNTTHTVLL